MDLNEESINAYKTILEDPAKHGFDFRPLSECFEKAEQATPAHLLFKEFLDYIQKPLPKVFFYIIMDRLYPKAKAPNGDMGYLVTFKKATA
jgi:hypothetical protein